MCQYSNEHICHDECSHHTMTWVLCQYSYECIRHVEYYNSATP